MFKECKLCKEVKDKDLDFPWHTKNVKRRSFCHKCISVKKKIKYQENSDKIKEKNRGRRDKYYADIQVKLYDYLTEHPCINCNKTEPLFLEFDHRDPKNKICSVSNMVSLKKPWLIILSEIEKCDVLCLECHNIKTGRQQNWFKYRKYIERSACTLDTDDTSSV